MQKKPRRETSSKLWKRSKEPNSHHPKLPSTVRVRRILHAGDYADWRKPAEYSTEKQAEPRSGGLCDYMSTFEWRRRPVEFEVTL